MAGIQYKKAFFLTHSSNYFTANKVEIYSFAIKQGKTQYLIYPD